MLVVRIELHSARTGTIKEIGRMHIANVSGKGNDSPRADYHVTVWGNGNKRVPLRTASVQDYPRLSYNVWRLVLRALRAAWPEERGTQVKGQRLS